MVPVLKLGDNPQTRSKFAKAEHVYRMLDPIITKARILAVHVERE